MRGKVRVLDHLIGPLVKSIWHVEGRPAAEMQVVDEALTQATRIDKSDNDLSRPRVSPNPLRV